MDEAFKMQLEADLIRDEGLSEKPYHDSVGVLTIGVGRNLEDRGITAAEARILLENDIGIVCGELDSRIPWWINLSDARRRALINMCFNLGWPRLSGFKKMLDALALALDLEDSGAFDFAKRKYVEAAAEALDSKWAKQVGGRAIRIAKMIKEG